MSEQSPETGTDIGKPLWRELLQWGGAVLVTTLATRGLIDQSNPEETSNLVEVLTVVGETVAGVLGIAGGIAYLSSEMDKQN